MVYPRNWCGIWLACTYCIILQSIDIVVFFSQGCSQHSQVDCSCGACCRVKCFCCILWSTEPTMIVKNNNHHNHRGFMGYIGYMTNIDQHWPPKKQGFCCMCHGQKKIGINEWGPWSSIPFFGCQSSTGNLPIHRKHVKIRIYAYSYLIQIFTMYISVTSIPCITIYQLYLISV